MKKLKDISTNMEKTLKLRAERQKELEEQERVLLHKGTKWCQIT